uniref:Putative secreted protein n=1 Tax=Anopheles triannulatus TaxID=58253 RepID=A0A2M4B532_9DIPT
MFRLSTWASSISWLACFSSSCSSCMTRSLAARSSSCFASRSTILRSFSSIVTELAAASATFASYASRDTLLAK